MSQRFGKNRRLLKRREFLLLQRSCRGVSGAGFTLLARQRGDAEPARLGVVASRKVGNAVERNRARRRIREWFRQHDELSPGLDLVVILRSGAADVPFAQLVTALDEALGRAQRRASRRGRRPAKGARKDPAKRAGRGEKS